MELVNGSLAMLCAVFSVLIIIAMLTNPQWRRDPAAKPALLMMAFVFVVLVSNAAAFLLLADRRDLFNMAATLNAVAAYLAEWFFGMFILTRVRITAAAKRVVLITLGVFCLAGGALYLSNGVHPFFFDFRRMEYLNIGGFLFFSILNYGFFLFSGLLLLFRGGEMPMRDRIVPSATQLLPLTSFLWDSLFPGLLSWDILCFIAMAANSFHLLFMAAETAQQKIDQLELKRIRANLERIKPHYIFNVLSSIYYLCDQDVGTAKESIQTFSFYLRDVLNMMEDRTLIPLSRELQTGRNYLELEQLRFGDRIRVRYQVEADGFLLPPFSLQPLVENSVKHGVQFSEKGGEISISSAERPDCFEVTVSDSFEGFNAEKAAAAEGSGTKYVRDILAMTVGGTLRISSSPGKGTVSVITIPKKP